MSHTLHVSPHGCDTNEGSVEHPLKTISAAARLAQPGDQVIVHEGIYREAIDPPRGGNSDNERITYRAATDEQVDIRGSEIVRDWVQTKDAIWSTRLPNSIFGDFNPYEDLIRGDWFADLGRPHHTGCVYLNNNWLIEAASLDQLSEMQWFAQVGETETTFWAHFGDTDPNTATTEVNVRQTVFYPSKTGINYITVSGFNLRHAATNWAPPTAEQKGLIGTHWSKGWIIENNTISHSRCTAVTLGKHGDQYDNTSADTATGYVETIDRAIQQGWHGDNIGGHIVRNNHISDCEQAGIVGSLGGIFSKITGNTIHDIHQHKLFAGEEQAAIKLHGAIDTLIANNHIHSNWRAIWLDWMAQGTRVTGNLCYDHHEEDIFLEVNHGPIILDQNILLSPVSIKNWSQGSAFIHNLLGGELRTMAEPNRETPYLKPHSTETIGLATIISGDDRYLNNWITDPGGLEKSCADKRDALRGDWIMNPETGQFHVHEQASQAWPSEHRGNHILKAGPKLSKASANNTITITLDQPIDTTPTDLSTTDFLPNATTNLPYLNYNGDAIQWSQPSGPLTSIEAGNCTVHIVTKN